MEAPLFYTKCICGCGEEIKVKEKGEIRWGSRECRTKFPPGWVRICKEQKMPLTREAMKAYIEKLKVYHSWSEIAVLLRVTGRTCKVYRVALGMSEPHKKRGLRKEKNANCETQRCESGEKESVCQM